MQSQRRGTRAAIILESLPTPTRGELVAIARKCLKLCLETGTTKEDRWQLAAIKLAIEAYDVEAEAIGGATPAPIPIKSVQEIAELTEILRQKRKAG